MKRFLFTVLSVALLVLVGREKDLLGRMFDLQAPATRHLQKGDWLSKVALEQYGDMSYWRELALVNRAPDADLIFPEEEIIVPSPEAIRRIRDARSLTTVNRLFDEQVAIVAASRQEGKTATGEQTIAEKTRDKPAATSPEMKALEKESREQELQSGRSKTNGSLSYGVDSPATNGTDWSTPLWILTLLAGVVLCAIVLTVVMAILHNKKRMRKAGPASKDPISTESGQRVDSGSQPQSLHKPEKVIL